MAKAIHLSSAKSINTLETPLYFANPNSSSPQMIKVIRCARKNEGPLIAKRASKSSRRVITIPASTGRWHGKWSCEYIITLKDLLLDDLAEDGLKGTEVFVTLTLQKHTGFGLSVDGRVMTNIGRKCSSCWSPYTRKIDTSISVWVLPDGGDDSTLPEIGGDDPSVIYVKPGCEAELDSLIQDTIRLQVAVKETCSESCEMSEPKLHWPLEFIGRPCQVVQTYFSHQYKEADNVMADIGAPKTASLDQRWSRLLHLRKSTQ